MSNYFDYLSKDNINDICNYLDEASKYMLSLSCKSTKFLCQNYSIINIEIILYLSWKLGYLHIRDLLINKGYKIYDSSYFQNVVLIGDIKMIEIMKKYGYIANRNACLKAVNDKNLEALEWLIKNGFCYDIVYIKDYLKFYCKDNDKFDWFMNNCVLTNR